MENYKLDAYGLATLLQNIPDYPVESNELEKIAQTNTVQIEREHELLNIVEALYTEIDNGKSPSSVLNKRRGQLTMFVLDVLSSKIKQMDSILRPKIAYRNSDKADENEKIIEHYQIIQSYAAELGDCLKKMYPQEFKQKFNDDSA